VYCADEDAGIRKYRADPDAAGANEELGLFVAMSDDRTFHYYSWADVAGRELIVAPNGEKPEDR